MTDDARDLNAARAGDHQAFARLYDRHAAVVFSLCRGRCADEAEDATQETFIRAYKLLSQLDDPEALRPWLYAIARRVCAERSRAVARRHRHEEAAVMIRTARLSAADSSLDAAGKAEQLDRLTAAIEALPDDERLAIHLFYIEDDPAAVAAAAIRLSRAGFYKFLARARNKLASRMREVPSR
jgi:RNA polymerase sigma-70 factor (ECF subfamily)